VSETNPTATPNPKTPKARKRPGVFEHAPVPPEQVLIRRKELRHYCPFSRSKLAEEMAAGRFPLPIRLSDGGRAVAWLLSEILAWQQARLAVRAPQSSASSVGRPRKPREPKAKKGAK